MAITKTSMRKKNPSMKEENTENYCELKEKHNNSLDSKEETPQHETKHVTSVQTLSHLLRCDSRVSAVTSAGF